WVCGASGGKDRRVAGRDGVDNRALCGSWLACDNGFTFNTGVDCQFVIAGKPDSHRGSAAINPMR
ncbi:hypothetical protein Q6264_31310, partial [Klebsiella pneumoniae]|uniref:hypothetical protein n=1 Tax=Klebsiella pneumoniae TaxID=573 RepID=UPI002731B687